MVKHELVITGIVLFLAACSGKPTDRSAPQDSTTITVAMDSAAQQVTTEPQSESDYEIDNCVFDTSPYKFTTDALKRHKADIAFTWDK